MKPLFINRRTAAKVTSVLLGACGVACQPTPSSRGLPAHHPLPPSSQDVSTEWEAQGPGSVELCDSPRAFVPFEKPIERQVFDVFASYDTGLDESMERLTAKVIVDEAARYGLDPWLVVGVIRVESRFNNFAQSNRDARGLMQLRPFVAEELAENLGITWTGPDSLYNPAKNVKLGVAYLAILNHRFGGNLDRSLAAYNMGPNRVREWLEAGRDLPTGYAALVTDYRGLLASAGKGYLPGSDLRGPVSAIERRMARRAAAVILPVVADVDPSKDGIATAVAVKGLLSTRDHSPKAAEAAFDAPDGPNTPDPELDAILK